MNKKLLAAAVLLTVFYAPALCQEADAEQSAVKRAVETYLYAEEPAEKSVVVHPKARIYGVNESSGKLRETSISTRARREPKSATNVRSVSRQRVAGVELAGDAALVRVETDLAPNGPPRPKHTQFISLLKLDGEWKIVCILMPNI